MDTTEQKIRRFMAETGADGVTVDFRDGPDNTLVCEVDARSNWSEWGPVEAATLDEALAALPATMVAR